MEDVVQYLLEVIGLRYIANYHTHVKLCGHASGMSEDYILEAIKHGLKEIGISDHGPIPRSFMTPQEYINNWLDRQMNEVAYRTIYLKDLSKTIEKYQKKIKIRKGLEIEYLSNHPEYYQTLLQDLDYLLLGVHYFETPNGLYNTYEPMDDLLLTYYAETVEKALATGFFKVLVHPDLCFANYRDVAGQFHFTEHAKYIAKRIIIAANQNNVALEINAGGIRKVRIPHLSRLDFAYPRYDFWSVVQEFPQTKIIIGSDAHQPHELADEAVQTAFDFSDQFGFPLLETLSFE